MRIVAENVFDHRQRYGFLAPHHTHYAVFFILILVAIRICYRSSTLVFHFAIWKCCDYPRWRASMPLHGLNFFTACSNGPLQLQY